MRSTVEMLEQRIFLSWSNLGFESPALGSGNYEQTPSGAEWQFSGNAGITANASSVSSGADDAPEGSQAGYLQGGSIWNDVPLSAGGTRVHFSATLVPGSSSSTELDVQLGMNSGSYTASFELASTGWQNLSVEMPASGDQPSYLGFNGGWGGTTVLVDNLWTERYLSAPTVSSDGYGVQICNANLGSDVQFILQRSDDNGATFQSIGTVTGGGATTADTTVSSNTTYQYRFAYDGMTSDPVSITTGQILTFSAPSVSENTPGTVELSWSSFRGDMTYTVQRRSGGGSFADIAQITGDGYSTMYFSDYYVSPGTNYDYRIQSTNGYVSGVGSITTQSAPTPFDAPSASYNNPDVYLTWNAHGSSGSYTIERSYDNIHFSYAGNSSSTSFTDPGNFVGYTLYYRIYDGSEYSGVTSITPSPSALQAPVASTLSPYAARIAWDPGDSGASSFRILRSDDNGQTYSAISLNGTDVFYVGSGPVDDTTALPGHAHLYEVQPLDGYLSGQTSQANPITMPGAKPLVRIGAHNNRVVAGEPYTIRLAFFPVAGVSFDSGEVNWGDGSSPEPFLVTQSTLTHIYAVSGRYTITATLFESQSRFMALACVSYDSDFGSNGAAVTDLQNSSNDDAAAVARDSSGRLLVAATDNTNGRFVLLRYNTDGTLDTTFGSEATKTGKAFIDFGNNASGQHYAAHASAILIDDQDRIYVAGDVYTAADGYDFAVARFNPDGTRDSLFGSAGNDGWGGAITDFVVKNARANAIAINWSTGDIVLAGYADGTMALARYSENGSPDATFGTNGTLTVDLSARADIIYAVKIDSQNRIVAAGRANQNMAVLRFNPDGTDDTTFGTAAAKIFDIGADDHVYDFDFDSTGNIVLVGSADSLLCLMRLTDAGALDTSFSADGWLTDSRYDGSYLWKVSVAADGTILAGGNTIVGRWLDDGTPDANFGDGGVVEWNSTGAEINEVRALAMFAGEDEITVVGQTLDQNNATNISVMRLMTDRRVLVVGKEPTLAIASDPNNPTSPGEGDSFTVLLSASSNSDDDVITGWTIYANGHEFDVTGNPASTVITLPSGQYTITAEATGTYGDVYEITDGIAVDVTNVEPTLSVDPPANTTVNEGDSVSLHASASDVASDVLEFTWDITKDGNPFATYGGPDLDFVPDDNGDYVITPSVTDESGATDTGSPITIHANNEDPTVDAGENQTVDEGETAYLYAYGSDPGSADTLSYHWTVQASNGDSISDGYDQKFSFTPADNGTYTVTLTATDDDGGTATDTVTVTAQNVSPGVLTGFTNYAVDPTVAFNLPFTLSDVPADTQNYTVDWGDDTTPASQDSVSSGSYNESHDFNDPTSYHHNHFGLAGRTITVHSTDKDGGVSTDAAKVAVDYVNNFNDGIATEWGGGVSQTPSGEDILGLFGNETKTLTLTGLPAHDVLNVEMDVYVFGQWRNPPYDPQDPQDPNDPPPPQITTSADGDSITPTSSCDAGESCLGDPCCGGWCCGGDPPPTIPVGPIPTSPDSPDWQRTERMYHVSFRFLHNSSTLNLGVIGENLATGSESVELWGIDNVHISADKPQLTAYRTGLRMGDQVTNRIKAETAQHPEDYVVLVNNDVEETPQNSSDAGTKDFDDQVADITGADDDLARITLHRLVVPPSGTLPTGTVELKLSDPTAVRLFKADGTLLYDGKTGSGSGNLSFSLASPSGYLAGVLSGDRTIWLEALKSKPDFSISYQVRKAGQTEPLANDAININLVQWDIVRGDGQIDVPVELTGLESLEDAVHDSSAVPPVAGAETFKSRFIDLSDASLKQLRVFDPTNPADYFDDACVQGLSRMEAGLYVFGFGGDVLTPIDRDLLKSSFGLNAVQAAAGARAVLETSLDSFTQVVAEKLKRWTKSIESEPVDPKTGRKPTWEDKYRVWIRENWGFHADAKQKELRSFLIKFVSQDNPKIPCSQVELWPLLSFAQEHALPVRLAKNNNTPWQNFDIDANGVITHRYFQPDANEDTMRKQVKALQPVYPQNWLNWGDDGNKSIPLNVRFTNEDWSVLNPAVLRPLKQGAVAREIQDQAASWETFVANIREGDVVAGTDLDGWPGTEKQSHADTITDIAWNEADTLKDGNPTLKTRVYLMYNSSADGNKFGEWLPIQDLLTIYKKGVPGYNNNWGHQFVIRSLNFKGFDQMLDRQI